MIQFKKVIVHNFGSYGHAELELQNRGFCLVSGRNNYLKDNALSNGSGKSFIWSAICYALTGETINGIRTNLKNINIEEQECYVQLDFVYNKDLISIIRYVAPKSDLKIFKNDTDLSGKGIRESEKKLQELIPELNKDLVSSTIIIGQGMPNKFSSFSPSGRKELLEKLTRSDFMVEDLKERIHTRLNELSVKVREYEDSLLTNRTQLNSNLTNLEVVKQSLEQRSNTNLDNLIEAKASQINLLQQELCMYEQAIADVENNIEAISSKLVVISDEKSKVSSDELNAYMASYTKLNNEKTKIDLDIINLTKEITKLKSVVDTCPTCGQHLPDIHKPDTSCQEELLKISKAKYVEIQDSITKCENQHKAYIVQINAAFDDEIAALNKALVEAKSNLNSNKTNQAKCSSILASERLVYNKLIYDKQNLESFITAKHEEIMRIEAEIARLTNLVAIISISKEDVDQRISIVKKMDSLIRRDFRGYLLINIINYIDNKAKDYCSTVFGTRELSLALNGNALDITYCGKAFDGLSGGEKQRVDLILQLAIRDLLTAYLGLNTNILVLDEITDFLDKKSCQAVMQLLEKELNTVESVFIISHHAEELELPVDSEVHIVKNVTGISEIV